MLCIVVDTTLTALSGGCDVDFDSKSTSGVKGMALKKPTGKGKTDKRADLALVHDSSEIMGLSF